MDNNKWNDLDVGILRLTSAVLAAGMSLGHVGAEWKRQLADGSIVPALAGIGVTLLIVLVLKAVRSGRP
jgi:hypothetical protein